MTTSPDRIGGIVLAGGRSSRFGSDKLEARIDGRSMLDLAVAAVQAVATEIVVCASPEGTPVVGGSVRIAHDATAFDGPLAGVATGLQALPPGIDRVVVVAGDMPSVAPAVLRLLLDEVAEGAAAACLADGDGRPRPLPAAYRVPAATLAVQELLASGERRLRRLPDRLSATVLPAAVWRAFDPTGATLRDIDSPADLERPFGR